VVFWVVTLKSYRSILSFQRNMQPLSSGLRCVDCGIVSVTRTGLLGEWSCDSVAGDKERNSVWASMRKMTLLRATLVSCHKWGRRIPVSFCNRREICTWELEKRCLFSELLPIWSEKWGIAPPQRLEWRKLMPYSVSQIFVVIQHYALLCWWNMNFPCFIECILCCAKMLFINKS
jgi:hypothetical protein